jgi:class 3 adenylate cyclase/tetratricopeptide (TPR) repeat protein
MDIRHMDCPSCHTTNKAGRTFCSSCGEQLSSPCSRCDFVNDPGDQFCGKCGRALATEVTPAKPTSPHAYTPKHLAEKILISRSALEGERKQVTVLFVDVSGFTSLSERLDPEDVHGLMTRAFELMLASVHRYEGTVNQFLGDGIMALFGAPIAHEDHARRAVHAALDIRAALGRYHDELARARRIGFLVRQGLNTGLVVVGSIGTDLRMDYTALGDTTNVAARLQQAAERGRILISEATHRLVEGYFHLRPLGHLALKGKVEPVRAWEAISARAVRTRLEVEAERGLTPYVGRERELRLLQDCFERARAGHGQVVFVVGEPGIGKSRLLHEFRRRMGDQATWLEGRCISFGLSFALHPVIDMMKRAFRIEEGDSETAIATKVEHSVLLLGEDLRRLVPYLRYLLSVDPGDPTVLTMDPRQRRAEMFDALRQLLVRASHVRPQVMVIEDVHWIDKASEESLIYTADSIPGARILQILTYRPGYAQPFGEHSYHTRLVLRTLSTEDSIQMAQTVLTAESLPDELKSMIVTKAEGNPFFVEEVVKSLRELGAIRQEGERSVLARRLEEIVVPDTIQGVIMARIDRLAEAPKKTLQLASVIGREFTRRLLERIADIQGQIEGLLHELKAIELIYEKALFPELAYMFKHALTHDVAYHSLLLKRRKELHHLIGVAIEELYAERLSEHYEVLAHHFSRAEDWVKALEYLVKSAEKAASAFANREAIALYDQAQEVSRHLGDLVNARTLMTIHQARADLSFILSDFEGARVEGLRCVALARQTGDRFGEAVALAGIGLASRWAHRFDEGIVYARQAIEIATDIDAKAVLASGHFTTGAIQTSRGGLDEARTELEYALRMSHMAGDASYHSLSLVYLGLLQNWTGQFPEAARLLSDALGIARTHGLTVPLMLSLFVYGVSSIGKGDYDAALAALEEGLAFSEKVGDEVYRHRLLNTLGWLCSELGELDRATELNRRGVEGGRKRGDSETFANAAINLGETFLAKGDLTLAQECLEEIDSLVKDAATSEWMKWRYRMHLFASLGDLWLARGDSAKAQELARGCLEQATHFGSRKYMVRGWRLDGESALIRRQWDYAEQALRRALEIAQAIGNPPQLWKTHAALGRLYTGAKRPDQALVAYRAACEVVEGVKAKLLHPDLRASLERAPLIRQIYEQSAPR